MDSEGDHCRAQAAPKPRARHVLTSVGLDQGVRRQREGGRLRQVRRGERRRHVPGIVHVVHAIVVAGADAVPGREGEVSPDVHIVEARLGNCGERAPAVGRQPFTLRNTALRPVQVERVEVHGLGWRVAGAENERAASPERRRHAAAHAEHRHLEEAGRRGRDGLPFTEPQLTGQAPPCGRSRRVGRKCRPAEGRLVEGAQDSERVTEGIERVAVGADQRLPRGAATDMEIFLGFEHRRHGWRELQAAKGVRQAECRHVDR